MSSPPVRQRADARLDRAGRQDRGGAVSAPRDVPVTAHAFLGQRPYSWPWPENSAPRPPHPDGLTGPVRLWHSLNGLTHRPAVLCLRGRRPETLGRSTGAGVTFLQRREEPNARPQASFDRNEGGSASLVGRASRRRWEEQLEIMQARTGRSANTPHRGVGAGSGDFRGPARHLFQLARRLGGSGRRQMGRRCASAATDRLARWQSATPLTFPRRQSSMSRRTTQARTITAGELLIKYRTNNGASKRAG